MWSVCLNDYNYSISWIALFQAKSNHTFLKAVTDDLVNVKKTFVTNVSERSAMFQLLSFTSENYLIVKCYMHAKTWNALQKVQVVQTSFIDQKLWFSRLTGVWKMSSLTRP